MSGFTFPAARVPDPLDAPSLRWGIAGPGWIAEQFVESLMRHSSQRVTAVGSRSFERAAAFGMPRGLRAHGSYEELAADSEVDVVYVATTHTTHLQVALTALEAGKHVLIEKPLGLSAAQAETVREAAAARGLFAAEAMWTLFLPGYDVVRQLVRDGHLGELRSVIGDFGDTFPAEHRIHDPEQAGGPLLDLGVYLFGLATDVLGEASSVSALGTSLETGVNGQLSAVLGFPGGAHAVLSSTIEARTPGALTIAGTEGSVFLDAPFHQPGGFTLATAHGVRHRWEAPAGDHVDGLHFEAAAVARAIAEGRTEAAERPLEGTLRTLRAMDAARAQLGIVYPGE